ncbi:hypothetical protein D3C71_1431680 [compost metagenome]
MRQRRGVFVVLVLVGAVRSLVIHVLRLRHEAVLLERVGNAGIAHVQHFFGAIGVAHARPVAAVGRAARGIAAAAVDGLREADQSGHRVQAQVVALACGLVEGPVGIVVARRGKELDAMLLRILVHDLDQAPHVHGLAVVGEVARQRDVLHAARDRIIQRGQKGEVIFVEQAGGRQLRVHRPDRGVVAMLRIGDAGKRPILEVGVDVMEVDVGHERDLHGGGRLGRCFRRGRHFRHGGRIVVLVSAASGKQGEEQHGACGAGIA